MDDKLDNLFNNGANWVRADFHLHSPFVDSFKLPSGINLASADDKNTLMNSYVQVLKTKNIKVAAITDYQQIRESWFKPFQTLALKEGIFVFPGVELSVTHGKGLHILFIFEFSQDIGEVNRFIQSLDQNSHKPLIVNEREHRDITLQKPLVEVLSSFREKFPCVILFPHPEDTNGLLKWQPKEAAEYLKLSDGAEVFSDDGRTKLISTGICDQTWFSTKFALLENSDPKSFDDIGGKDRNGKCRCTYLKLSSVSIHAFLIALHDPNMRVRLYGKPEADYDRIISIDIKGSKFLRDVNLTFNQEMNTLIGGRGVGKSSIIESLRYVLDLPVYSEKSFRQDFVASVVGSGGEAIVKIQRVFGQKKKEDTAKRIIGQMPVVVERDGLSPKELFDENRIQVIVGQKELYELSSKGEYKLELVDEIIGEDVKKENFEFKKLVNGLKENAQNILLFGRKLAQKDEYEQKLKKISSHIETFKGLGVAEKMGQYAALLEDDKTFTRALEKVTAHLSGIKESMESASVVLKELAESLNSGKSQEKAILQKGAKIVSDLDYELDVVYKNFVSVFSGGQKKLEVEIQQWSVRKRALEEQMNEIKKTLAAQGLSPDRYEALIREKITTEPMLKEMVKVEDQIKKLLNERNDLKGKIKAKRHDIFKIREKRISDINKKLSDRLKIEIGFEEDRIVLKDSMRSILKGSGVSTEAIDSLLDDYSKALDGIELSSYIGQGNDVFKKAFPEISDAMTQKVIKWFADQGRLFEVESFFPEDKIKIFLKVGDKYAEFDKLSAGQKATALLILLFAQENRILIIDQPEEDLDNRFIYEDVVKILREMKGKRQIILVTHNANIPVLGDSELVLVLDSVNDECKIVNQGSIDKKSIVEDIKSIMEGGEEAFRRRVEKYGGLQ